MNTQAGEDDQPVGNRLLDTVLGTNIEFLMARARSIGSENANKSLSQLGLRVRSYSVLSLACSAAEPSQRELADFLSLDPSQIVALVDELEKRGLVSRRTDKRDRRSKVIVATNAGRRLNAEAVLAVQTATDESLSSLTNRERETLQLLLWKVGFSEGERNASMPEFSPAALSA